MQIYQTNYLKNHTKIPSFKKRKLIQIFYFNFIYFTFFFTDPI
jgi:hypothetical protein